MNVHSGRDPIPLDIRDIALDGARIGNGEVASQSASLDTESTRKHFRETAEEIVGNLPGGSVVRVFHLGGPSKFGLSIMCPAASADRVKDLVLEPLTARFGAPPRLAALYHTAHVEPRVVEAVRAMMSQVFFFGGLLDQHDDVVTWFTSNPVGLRTWRGDGQPLQELTRALPGVNFQVRSSHIRDLLGTVPDWLVNPRSKVVGERIEIHHSSDASFHEQLRELAQRASERAGLPVTFVCVEESHLGKRAERRLRLNNTPLVASEAQFSESRQRRLILQAVRESLPGRSFHIEKLGPVVRVVLRPHAPEDLLVGARMRELTGEHVQMQFRYWRDSGPCKKVMTKGAEDNARAFMEKNLPDWMNRPELRIAGRSIVVEFANVMNRENAFRLHALGESLKTSLPFPVTFSPKFSVVDVYRIAASELRCSGWQFNFDARKGTLQLALNTRGERDIAKIQGRIAERTGLLASICVLDETNQSILVGEPSLESAQQSALARAIQQALPAWLHNPELLYSEGRWILHHSNDLDFDVRLSELQELLSSRLQIPLHLERVWRNEELIRILAEELPGEDWKFSLRQSEKRVVVTFQNLPQAHIGQALDAIEARSGYRVEPEYPHVKSTQAGDLRLRLMQEYDLERVKAAIPDWAVISRILISGRGIVVSLHNELPTLGDLRAMKSLLMELVETPVDIVHSFRDSDLYRIVASEIRGEQWLLGCKHAEKKVVLKVPESLAIAEDAIRESVQRRCGYDLEVAYLPLTDFPPNVTEPTLQSVERVAAEELATSHYELRFSRDGTRVHISVHKRVCLTRELAAIARVIAARSGCEVKCSVKDGIAESGLHPDLKFDLDSDLAALRKIARQVPRSAGAYVLEVSSASHVNVRHNRFMPADVRSQVGSALNKLSRFKVSLLFDRRIS